MSRIVTVLGTGGMGAGMARCLLSAGYTVRVWNRTAAKTAPLVAAGATAYDNPLAAARGASAVVVSLAGGEAVADALTGVDGALPGLAAGTVVIDASTTSAETAVALADQARQAAVGFLECRVLGNPRHAAEGSLRILTGGDQDDYARVEDVLLALGRDVVQVGPMGSAAHLKIVLNDFLGMQLDALTECLDLAEAAGLQRDLALRVLSTGGYAAPAITFRAELVARHALDLPAFRVDLMAKDLRLAEALAQRVGADVPLTEHAAQLFSACAEHGDGARDSAAVLLGLGRAGGVAA